MNSFTSNLKKLYLPALRKEGILYPACFFLPKDARHATLSLLCLSQDLLFIQESTNSALTAKVRLTWWQEQISELWKETPASPSSPILQWIKTSWRAQSKKFQDLTHAWLEALKDDLSKENSAPDTPSFNHLTFYSYFFKVAALWEKTPSLEEAKEIEHLAEIYWCVLSKMSDKKPISSRFPESLSKDFSKTLYLRNIYTLVTLYEKKLKENSRWQPLPLTPYWSLIKKRLKPFQ